MGLGLILVKVVGEILVRVNCDNGLLSKGSNFIFGFFLFSSNNLIDDTGEHLLVLLLIKGDTLLIVDLWKCSNWFWLRYLGWGILMSLILL